MALLTLRSENREYVRREGWLGVFVAVLDRDSWRRADYGRGYERDESASWNLHRSSLSPTNGLTSFCNSICGLEGVVSPTMLLRRSRPEHSTLGKICVSRLTSSFWKNILHTPDGKAWLEANHMVLTDRARQSLEVDLLASD
ncbi:MAG: hypothetical protein O7C01_11140 [Actinobacteria bacterium]|nr:hypothetical protein [Actinomycetota bacterium]